MLPDRRSMRATHRRLAGLRRRRETRRSSLRRPQRSAGGTRTETRETARDREEDERLHERLGLDGLQMLVHVRRDSGLRGFFLTLMDVDDPGQTQQPLGMRLNAKARTKLLQIYREERKERELYMFERCLRFLKFGGADSAADASPPARARGGLDLVKWASDTMKSVGKLNFTTVWESLRSMIPTSVLTYVNQFRVPEKKALLDSIGEFTDDLPPLPTGGKVAAATVLMTCVALLAGAGVRKYLRNPRPHHRILFDCLREMQSAKHVAQPPRCTDANRPRAVKQPACLYASQLIERNGSNAFYKELLTSSHHDEASNIQQFIARLSAGVPNEQYTKLGMPLPRTIATKREAMLLTDAFRQKYPTAVDDEVDDVCAGDDVGAFVDRVRARLARTLCASASASAAS